MNATDAIKKIKEMLGLEFSEETTTVETTDKNEATLEFAETTLMDSETVVTNDKESDFEMGDIIYVKEGDTLSPAPSGEHTLRDGYVIVLDEESRLIEIRIPRSEDVADVVDTETVEAAEEMSEETEETQINFEEELNSIKSSIEAMLKLMEQQTETFNKEVEELKTEVETFKQAPERVGITEKKGVKENFSDYRVALLRKHIK